MARETGLNRSLQCGDENKYIIVESIGTGCGFLDYDGDGRLDIYLANAGSIVDLKRRPGPGVALYRQGDSGAFHDMTEAAGLSFHEWGTGVAVADVNNDSYPDIFLGTFGDDRLYVNQGNGSFKDLAGAIGLPKSGITSSAAFLDYDRDGYLDLFVCGYVELDLERPHNEGKPCTIADVKVSCAPTSHFPALGRMFHNKAGTDFEDVTSDLGIDHKLSESFSLGVVTCDCNQDGWMDIYVANDGTANHLWINRGGVRFEEVGIKAGVAFDEHGKGQAGMGVDAGDFDADGLLDFVVSNYSGQYFSLYRNSSDGAFEDISWKSGLAEISSIYLGWGIKWVDIDNDGDLDLVAANGHVHPQVQEYDPTGAFRQRLLILQNTGQGKLTEISAGSDAMAAPRAHRALAVGDYDNDGDTDLLVTVLDGLPLLFRNDASGLGNWIRLHLVGVRSNRDAIGARVILYFGEHRAVREVSRGGSYLSAHDVRLTVGLGTSRMVERALVRWPSGLHEEFVGLESGREHRVVEGSGRAVPDR